MNTFHLKDRVGFGREINIETSYGTYSGSGRCLLGQYPNNIIQKKPSKSELENQPRATGFCSRPHVRNGDVLICDNDTNEEIILEFKNVRYLSDPNDMFFADLVLYKEKTESKSISTIQKLFKSFLQIFKK
jgi:hypothetical protein